MKKSDIRQAFTGLLSILFLGLLIQACANIGNPDGGPYDETPPKFVRSSPALGAINAGEKKITLEFDEFIKLEKPSEKVIVSPAQLEQPEIKSNGKKVTITLLDSLKPGTTYTIDFGDAIVDNNEGNPLGLFTYAFSTGAEIDTMEVSGTVLDASNLEPIKGMLVGLHANLNDTAFTQLPLERISRTDSRGHFVIKGVKPSSYRVYGLQDANQNYRFDQKAEMIAFQKDSIFTSSLPAVRQDTVWHDSLRYDTIIDVNYTRYLPDDIVLRAFTEEKTDQYLVKNERIDLNKLSFYFAAKNDTLPELIGLNFKVDGSTYILEKSLKADTLHYWLRDSSVYNLDTLNFAYRYHATDTLGQLVVKTDTFEMAAKNNKEKLLKEAAKKKDDFEKELKKRLKKGDSSQMEMPHIYLPMKVNVPSGMAPDQNIFFEFDEPILSYNDTAIHLKLKVDSLWNDIPFIFRPVENQLRSYELLAEWKPEQEYQLTVDSAAFIGLYGKESKKEESHIKMKSLNDYASLFIRITSPDSCAVVQLLSSDKPIKQVTATQDGKADFFFINPGKYYVRAFIDRNHNGVWDTGNYKLGQQAEEVYYYPGEFELKALWDIEQDWDLHTRPLDQQKPTAIIKQKPETEKKIRNRNAERQMGKKR